MLRKHLTYSEAIVTLPVLTPFSQCKAWMNSVVMCQVQSVMFWFQTSFLCANCHIFRKVKGIVTALCTVLLQTENKTIKEDPWHPERWKMHTSLFCSKLQFIYITACQFNMKQIFSNYTYQDKLTTVYIGSFDSRHVRNWTLGTAQTATPACLTCWNPPYHPAWLFKCQLDSKISKFGI